MAKRERERASFSSSLSSLPFVFSSSSSEQTILDVVTPQLRQLSDLSNQAVNALAEADALELGQKHARYGGQKKKFFFLLVLDSLLPEF